jgi:hypothetical protein
MIRTFIHSMQLTYLGNSDNVSVLAEAPDPVSQLHQLTIEVLEFSSIVRTAFYLYYAGTEVARQLRDDAEELHDLVTDAILQPPVHTILVHAYSLAHAMDIAQCRQQINSYSYLTCAQVGIEPQFQLDLLLHSPSVYTGAVSRLKELAEICSPHSKLQCLKDITREILNSIDDYWGGERWLGGTWRSRVIRSYVSLSTSL